MGTRTSRINTLLGFCREFGIAIPVGARAGTQAISQVLADPNTAVPDLIRGTAKLLVEEIRLLEGRIVQLKRELAALAKISPACTTLLSIPGVGLLAATALVATTSGDVSHFKDARHFSSWFGMLLTHFARVVLHSSKVAQDAGPEVSRVRRWALDVQSR
jgi:transposase